MLLNKNPKLTIILVCIVGFGLASSGAYLIYDDNEDLKKIKHQQSLLEFRNTIDNRAAMLNRDLDVNFEALRSIAILFRDDKKPSSNQFDRLSESIILRRNTIQALSWIPRVQHSNRAAIEKSTRTTHPYFNISQRDKDGLTTASNRSEYFPVHYIYPLAGNERAIGFDLASDAIRLDALKKARDSGKLRATDSITLVQETKQQKGFLVFLPLYSGTPTTLEDRQKNLTGFLTSVYRIGDIFNGSALSELEASDIAFKLIEKTSSNETKTIFISKNFQDVFNSNANQTKEINGSVYFYEKELADILGKKWTLFSAKKNTTTYRSTTDGPILFAVTGGIFSFFVVMYIRKVAHHSLELSDINQKLDTMSHTDGLTKIPNRRTFDEYVEKEWHRAARSKTFISVLIIDVDYFKLYNDHYGHAKGDQVLKQVASALNTIIKRPSDLLARYGGEEFIIVLPDTEDATSVAYLCTQVVRDLKIPHEFSASAPIITVSVGLETCIPDSSADLSMIVENADKALYAAKENGRNRVAIFAA
jgi:diguanylate cyclase (GGDEF)-like protein